MRTCDFCIPQSDDITKVSQAAKIVERMVNQNTYDDVAQGKFLLFLFIFCCVCACVCVHMLMPVCLNVHSEEGMDLPELVLLMLASCLMGTGNQNPGPLQVLLAAEPTCQSQK